MRRSWVAIALVGASVVAAACGDAYMPTMPSPGAPAGAPFVSEHFLFSYTDLDIKNIAQTASVVEAEYLRITQDLGASNMPPVNVWFYLTHRDLERAVDPVVGSIPKWSTGLVTAQNQIHMMSPNQGAYGPYSRRVSDLVHEFAHCVSINVNSRIGNNPRWLWESVAIYESGQLVEPKNVPYLVAGAPPSFATLNSMENTLIYDVGYTIAEFIVARGGAAALRQLIVNNGNVNATLGMNQASFERAWFEFVRARYGI